MTPRFGPRVMTPAEHERRLKEIVRMLETSLIGDTKEHPRLRLFIYAQSLALGGHYSKESAVAFADLYCYFADRAGVTEDLARAYEAAVLLAHDEGLDAQIKRSRDVLVARAIDWELPLDVTQLAREVVITPQHCRDMRGDNGIEAVVNAITEGFPVVLGIPAHHFGARWIYDVMRYRRRIDPQPMSRSRMGYNETPQPLPLACEDVEKACDFKAPADASEDGGLGFHPRVLMPDGARYDGRFAHDFREKDHVDNLAAQLERFRFEQDMRARTAAPNDDAVDALKERLRETAKRERRPDLSHLVVGSRSGRTSSARPNMQNLRPEQTAAARTVAAIEGRPVVAAEQGDGLPPPHPLAGKRFA